MRAVGSRTGAQPLASQERQGPEGQGTVRVRSKRRREEIMNAAAVLFARRGFHGVSIDDIGSAAGMSGPGIYRHFPSKEAVLSQMLLDISERLLAEGGRRASAAADAQEALDALLRRQIRRLQRLYVEEWVTVLSELSPHAAQASLRAGVHAMFGLLNSTPHSASELPADAVAELLHAMARAALVAAAA
jgi:AcrR family transcriptional regulator